MPLTLVTGPANAEKAGHVLGAYAAAAARAPILVVPTFADVQTYRRELADRGVVFGAQVETWARLSSELVRRAGVTSRVLGPLARERVAALAVARTELRVLGDAARTPGFVPAFLRLVDELGAQRIDPGRWYAALRARAREEPRRADYAEDLAALYAALRRAQERLGRVDREQQVAEALDVLRTEPARWRGTPVFLYGFDDLTVQQRDAVETLAVQVGADVTASLPYEPGRVAFAGRHETYAHLDAIATERVALEARSEHYAPGARPALHHLERTLFEPCGERVDPGDAVLLLRGGGARAELELVAAHVARLIADGVAPEEIAVVIRRAPDHAALVEAVFGGVGIPVAIHREVVVGHTALGRGVLALARCALLPQDASADDLLAYLRTPGLLHVPALADQLEVEMRQDGAGDARTARERFEAQHFPLDAIDRVRGAAARGPGALCERLAAETAALFANPFRARAAVLAPDEVVDAEVAAQLRRALSELVRLAQTDAALVPEGAELLRTLATLQVRVGRRPGPGAVTVADPKDVRARRVRALFCCALQEGGFPAPARPDPFLGDAERAAINRASGLRLALDQDAVGRERYLFYATVSRPTDLLALSWHGADEDGGPAVRSLFVDDVLDLLTEDPPVAERPLGAAGFDEPLAPTPRERARAAAAADTPVDPQPIAPLGDARVLASLAARDAWSASGLETWLACPVRWFVERLLRPAELVPDPEPLIRGTLAHAVLERALSRLTAGGERRPLRPADLPEAWRLAHEAIEELRSDNRLSPNPERARAALHRLEGDVLRYLEWAAENGSVFAPSAFEVSFGGRDDPLPAVEVAPGLRLTGRIDRIDRGVGGAGAEGDAVIIDYKGASATAQARWAQDNRLQLALYALAVPEVLDDVRRVVGALYQPLAGTSRRPRGALLDGADPGLDVSRTDRVDEETFAALLDDARARAVAAVADIREGALRPSPDTCGWAGGGCAYPSICRCERG